MKKLKKLISIILVFSLLELRVVSAIPKLALADDPPAAPTQSQPPPPPPAPPTAPAAPTNPYVAPTAPPAPTNPYVAPTAPPAPTNPYTPPTAPTAPTNPFAQPTSSPTGSVTPTDTASPTTSLTGSPTGSDPSPTSSVNDPANTNTGPKSIEEANEILSQKYAELNKNLAEVQNKVDQITQTGFNYANLNTLDGQVFTGDSYSTLNLLNKLNSNMTGVGGFSVFNVYDNYSGNLVFSLPPAGNDGNFSTASANVSKNSDTGSLSQNNANSKSDFTVKEANGNDAKLTNDINLQSSTGSNSASMNTGGGTVKTGDATTIGNIINMVNTNLNVSQWLIGVVNVFGTLAGNIILPKDTSSSNTTANQTAVTNQNSNTGLDSTNNATTGGSSVASFDNANTAAIKGNVDVAANSGDNNASGNTGGSAVTTGNAATSVNDKTVANTNTTNDDGTVWLVIVNQMGKWVGYIVGSPWGATSASNSLPISSAGTTSQNENTGALSDNNASNNSTSNTSVTNNNTAEIDNNIKASADTGNNDASYNTGQGQIDTGNATVGLNLLNMVNTNVTAKKFVAVIVNVVGSFLGSVITPDQGTTNNTTAYSFDTWSDGSQNSATTPPTPTPTIPAGQTGGKNIGGVDTIPTPTPNQTYQQSVVTYNYYYQNVQNNTQTPQQPDNPSYYAYLQSLQKVNYYKQYVSNQSQLARLGPPGQDMVKQQIADINNLKRGLYLSPNFVKATESSLPGMLFGGASLAQVNESWLSIVPVAFIIYFVRRRRKINISKYLNYLLEVIL